MSTDVFSDPLVAAGLLLGLAGLLLVLGLAFQAGVNRRHGDPAARSAPVRARREGPSRDRGSIVDLDAWIDSAVETRVESLVEARIEKVEDEFEARIEDVEDALDAGIDEVEAKIATALERPEDRHWLREFEARIEKVEATIEDVEAKATTAVKPVTKNDEPHEGSGWIEEFDIRVKALQARIATTAEPVTNDRLPPGRRWTEGTAGANGSDGGAAPIETRPGNGRAEETVARVTRELERSSAQKTESQPPGSSGPAE